MLPVKQPTLFYIELGTAALQRRVSSIKPQNWERGRFAFFALGSGTYLQFISITLYY